MSSKRLLPIGPRPATILSRLSYTRWHSREQNHVVSAPMIADFGNLQPVQASSHSCNRSSIKLYAAADIFSNMNCTVSCPSCCYIHVTLTDALKGPCKGAPHGARAGGNMNTSASFSDRILRLSPFRCNACTCHRLPALGEKKVVSSSIDLLPFCKSRLDL